MLGGKIYAPDTKRNFLDPSSLPPPRPPPNLKLVLSLSSCQSKMADSSLVKLSVSAIVHQDGSFLDRCDLSSLPRNLLQELLVSSISYSRILCLKSLITNWPLEHLLLRNVVGFDEPKAVLLAYWLQRTKHNLKLVDMTGCNIGESNERKKSY